MVAPGVNWHVSGGAVSEDRSTGGLNIVVESVGQRAVVLHLAGELDMVTAPGFAEHVQQHVVGPSLVLDLSGVTFLGSAEARNLAVARAVQVRVVAVSRTVLRPMEVTGLDKVLTVVPDVATAIEQVGA
jgi:anti-sigma B factor antagonist